MMTKPIQVITAKYRVVTPMFLSGADQNRSELRLPSFKGALRFWWRAISAGRFNGDLKVLRAAEDALFGSTRTGQSRVRIRIVDQLIKTQNENKFNRNTWQSYIGYGLIDKSGQTQREYIAPDSWFTVGLGCSRCDDGQRQALRDALIAVGLLGGLGSRSRNGWGSITLENLLGLDQQWNAPADVPDLEKEINRLLASDLGLQGWTAATRESAYAIGKPVKDSEKAHSWLAQQYQTAIREIAIKPQREGFGLPRKNAGKNAGERRAGPVLLHVHQPEGVQAIPMALFFPGRFLAEQDAPSGGWQVPLEFIKGVRQA